MFFTTKNKILHDELKKNAGVNQERNKSQSQNIQVYSIRIKKESNDHVQKVVPPPPQPKKMKWGEPTWYLFHTLAHKIKPEYFNQTRLELLNVINTICNNLPCPTCANHATQYMKGVNFNAIQTQQQLKNLLFTFHNEVNKRKGMPLFPESELDSKYNNALLVPIIENFIFHFEDKHTGLKLLADNFIRQQVSKQLRSWFLQNLHKFYL